MARLRKVFIRHKSYFITFRTEAGLPFPATHVMNRILHDILCRAKSLYEIEVVCFKFMNNHFHLIVTVTCPEAVKHFIKYLKRESAHAVNRLVGRRKRTIWCAGYDSPIILDLKKLLNIISYIYTNAQTSNQVDKVEDYPGLSSWEMFTSNNLEVNQKRIPRNAIPYVGTGALSVQDQRDVLKILEAASLEVNTFKLSPYAFMKSFPEEEATEEEIKATIIEMVREREAEIREARKIPIVGRTKLITQGINLDYKPKKFGKRMICLASSRELRIPYISWFKSLCEKASYLYKKAIGHAQLPPGAFAPGGYLCANVWIPRS